MKDGKILLSSMMLALVLVFLGGGSRKLWAQQTEPPQVPASPEAQAPPAHQTDPAATPTQPPVPAPPQTPTTVTPSTPAATSPPPSPPPVQKDDRLFFALPNVLTVENADSLPPLTAKQKFKAEAEGVFDPVEIVFVGIQAGIGQADNDNPTYGQGFVGYSKRFGTAYADTVIASFNTGAIWPSILHMDPRYYQMGKGNAFHRIEYSAMRVVITRSDKSGARQFNVPEFLGNGIASVAANAYHPGPHTIVSTTNVFATQMVVDVLSNELKEFWPDLRRALTHKH